MKSFFRFFASRHLLALLLSLGIFTLGMSTLLTINRNMFPQVDFGEMVITTIYKGASASDVELNVTNKIEKELKGISGLKTMISFSQEEVSTIQLVLDPDIKNHADVKKDVRQAIDRVTNFPLGVDDRPFIKEINSDVFPVMDVGVISESVDYRTLRETSRAIEKDLRNIKGVSRVEAFGFRDRQVNIDVSLDKLSEYQVSLQTVVGAIQQRNIRASSGTVKIQNKEKIVTTLAEFENPQDVGDVIVRSNYEGRSVKVRDVATIKDTFEDWSYIPKMNGKRSITFRIYKSQSSDIINLSDRIKTYLNEKELGLGADYELIVSDDDSYYVRNRFDVVMSNGVMGLILIVLMLRLFFNFKTAFWIAMGIPIAVAGVIFLLPIFGGTLNVISLMAIIIVMGIIVDDAIIIAENIARHREQGDAPLEAAINGTADVFKPVITTILTTFIAFAPMFFMSGIMGKFISEIPLVVTLALAVSLLECTVALPAHLIPGLKKIKAAPKDGLETVSPKRNWFHSIVDFFRPILTCLLKYRYITLLCFLIFLGGSIWFAATQMKFVLFPDKISNEFIVDIELPDGTPIEETHQKIRIVEDLLGSMPKNEIDSYRSRSGMTGDAYWQRLKGNKAMIMVNLTPFSERDRTVFDIIDELKATSDNYEGFNYIKYNIEAGGPPVGKAINIRIIGANDDIRNRLAKDMIASMQSITGVSDIQRNDDPGKNQLKTLLNYEKMSRLGLTVSDVTQTLRTAIEGQTATMTTYDEDETDFVVQLKAVDRDNIKLFENLTVPNRQGRLISLSEIITLKEEPNLDMVYHFDAERTVNVTADLDKDLNTPMAATKEILSQIDLKNYPGMRVDVGGESEETQESIVDLLRTLTLSVLGIYFLLVILFNSFSQPFLVISILPFSFLSVVIILAIHNENLGFISMIGLIGLMGVVVNDALVLVYRINDLISRDNGMSINNAIIEGTLTRLRPIIVTSLTTIAGLLPLAYGIGGNDPFIAPMGLVLGYGLFFSTPIIVILLPCLLQISFDIKHFCLKKKCLAIFQSLFMKKVKS